MTTPLRSDEWAIIERLLPRGWEEAARTCGAFRRRRYTQAPRDVLRLLLFHAVSGTGMRATMAQAAAAGLSTASDVALLKRMRTSVEWLRWIAAGLCDRLRSEVHVPQGLRLRVIDSTTIQGPAAKSSEWRLHYTLDLRSLACDWHELTEARTAEALERAPVERGDVILGDRNFLRTAGVRVVTQRGGQVVIRMRWTHPRLEDEHGQPVQALTRARRLRVGHAGDWPVRLVESKHAPIEGRLVALRLPLPLAQQAQRRVQRRAVRKQSTLDSRSLEAAQYVLLFTTLSPEQLDAEGVLELYRFRWQVEVAFKRYKQLLALGRLPHQDPRAAQAWILAKLVIALLLETLYRNERAISPWGYTLAIPRRIAA